VRIAIACLLACGSFLAFGGPVFTVAGGGNINNALWNFAAGGGANPVFDASHQLTTIGNNLGTVGAVIAPQVNAGGGFPGAITQCINLGGGCGVIGNGFGSAATLESSGNYSVGFYFTLTDPTAGDGKVSITYAGAGNSGANLVTFTNTSGVPVTGRVGAVLAIEGTFGGQAGAVVGAALDGAISWDGNAPQEATVVLFGSSLPGQPTSVSASGVGGTNWSYFNCGFGFGCNNFVAWGVSLLNGGNPITIGPGQTLTINGALSVLADPIMSIDLFTLDPSTVVPNNINLPDFGASFVAPEPATWMLAGVALFGLGWKRWRRSA